MASPAKSSGKAWSSDEEFSLMYQLSTQNRPDFGKVDLPGRSERAMLHRMDKFKEDYKKIRAKEASQTVDGRNGGDAAETAQKRVKRTHNLPVIFPNLPKAVEDAKKNEESAEREEEEVGVKPTKIVILNLDPAMLRDVSEYYKLE